MERQQRTAAHASAPETPMTAPEWERPQHRTRNTVIAASCALCIIGATALGLALTLPSSHQAEESGSATLTGTDLADSEPAVPGDLRVLVDTWGQEPPEDGVSATYAAALASDVAERYFGAKPSGRARVVLSGKGWNYDPDYYDTAGDLAWEVEMQLEGGGGLTVMVGALNGVDASAWIDRDESGYYEGSWLEDFDEWERTGVPPSESYAEPERDPSAIAVPTIEELTDEERAERIKGYEAKRALAAEQIAEHAGDPRAEAMLAIVNETGLGDGATAISAEWASFGHTEEDCMIDVALDDGDHLFVRLEGTDPCELAEYERHHAGYLDILYSNEIARLQALMQ